MHLAGLTPMVLRTGWSDAVLFLMVMSGGMLWAQAPPPSAANAQPTPPGPAAVSVAPAKKSAEPESPLGAATELLRNGKLADSESAYRAILVSDPQSARGYVGLFRVLLREKRLTEAASAVAKAVELAPDSSAVRTARAELLFRQGRISEAQAVLTPLARADTSEARAYLGLGRIYWASSYYQHAKLMFDKAHERDPSDPDIRKFWLFTLTRKERIEELKSYLENAGAEDEDEREHLASSLVEMREDEKETSKGCRLVSTVEQTHIPMERMLYGALRVKGYGLKVQLNDAKARLLIDTGSTGILVNRKLGERAGIESIVKTDVHGIGDKGAVSSFVGVAKSIKIGDLEFQGCHVEVMDRNSVADEDGLIGGDVFSHFLVNINFPDSKIELTALPPLPPPSAAEKALTEKYPKIARFRDGFVPPELKTYTPIYRFGHQLLIPTRINDLPSKLFLIDTGAFTDTISPDAAREVTKVRSNSDYKIKGLNGLVNNVFTADNLTLTFSHYRQPANDVVAFDTSGISNSTGTEVSGTLGFAMLYQMQLKIDYRDGLVDFVYEPNRFH
jgi:tetratricopeptide (TPR) repeat protein